MQFYLLSFHNCSQAVKRTIRVGDTGTVKVPKAAKCKHGMKQVPVMVAGVSADNSLLVVHPIDPQTSEVKKDEIIKSNVPTHSFKHGKLTVWII